MVGIFFVNYEILASVGDRAFELSSDACFHAFPDILTDESNIMKLILDVTKFPSFPFSLGKSFNVEREFLGFVTRQPIIPAESTKLNQTKLN